MSRGRAKDKQPRAHREGSASSHPRDHGRDPAGRREDGNRNGRQTGRSVKERIGHKVTIEERLGPLGPETSHDARLRIDALKASSIIEEEDIAAHHCFGLRIRTEQFPKGFTLPRDTPKYDGSAKPEDWLADYVTAVNIASGNKRVAVRTCRSCFKGQLGLG